MLRVNGSQEKQELTEGQVDAICVVEQLFWLHGSIPTNEVISEKTGLNVKTVQGYWENPVFRGVLEHKGVPLDEGRSKDILSIKQLEVANRLLNIHDARSVREKLQEVGVSSQQYHAWLRQPAFREYLQKRGEELFKSGDHEAYTALMQVVRGGDVSGLKLFFEMRGIYNPKLQLDVNIEAVLVKVVEVVARHVRDPQVLQAIAQDLELIDQPGMPPIEVPLPVLEPVSQAFEI
jgi:hypothetical protein